MIDKVRIGVLFTAKEDGVQMGSIELDPGGMMIFRIIKPGLHFFAMKPIEYYFREKNTKPLYVKYAGILEEVGRIPDEILWQEAKNMAEEMNAYGVGFAAKSVRAEAIRF